MHSFFCAHPASDATLVSPRIHAVCYPYWGGRVRLSAKDADGKDSRWMIPRDSNTGLQYEIFDLNYAPEGDDGKPRDLTTKEEEWKVLRDKISKNYGTVANKIESFSDDLKSDKTDLACQNRLQKYMYDIWAEIATPNGSYYPVKKVDNTATVAGLSVMQYIQATFSDDGRKAAIATHDLQTNTILRKSGTDVKRYKVDEAQAPNYEQTLEVRGKRTHETTDDYQDCNPAVFLLTAAQETEIWNGDKTNDPMHLSSPSAVNLEPLVDAEEAISSSSNASEFSQLVIGAVIASDNALSVPTKSNLYYLIGGLHDQVMNLETPVTVDGKGWQRRLVYGDEFAAWIANIFYFDPKSYDAKDTSTPLATTSFSPWGSDSTSIAGFRVDVAQFCGTYWNLVWKSEPSLSSLVLGASTNSERQLLINAIDQTGIIPNLRTLVMGLDIRPTYRWNSGSSAKTFKLIDVLRLIAYIDPADTASAALPLLWATQLLDITLDLDMPVVDDYQTTADTGSDAVQALWFTPGNTYATTLRIDFVEHDDTLSGLLGNALGGCTIDKVRLATIRRTSFNYDNPRTSATPVLMNAGELCLKTKILLTGASLESAWDAFVVLDTTSVTFVLRWPAQGNPLKDLLAWIDSKSEMKEFGGSYNSFNGTLNSWSGGKDILLREVCIVADSSSGAWTLTSASMTLEVDLDWGIDRNVNANGLVPFKLDFSYRSVGGYKSVDFRAALWTNPIDITQMRLNPTSPLYPPLMPAIALPHTPVYTVSLDHLGFDDAQLQKAPIPKGVPHIMTDMQLDIATDQLYFTTTLASNVPTIGEVPTVPLESITFSATMTWLSGVTSIDLSLLSDTTLFSHDPVVDPALLTATIDYESSNGSSNWLFDGSVYKLTGGHLTALFPEEDRAGVINVISEIFIPELNVEFAYGNSGEGVSFTADGLVQFGEVALGIDFQYNTTEMQGQDLKWKFHADFSWAADPENGFQEHSQNLQSLISDICPSASIPDVLDFLKDVRLDINIAADLKLDVFKTSTGRYVLSLDASIKPAEFTFIQLSAIPNADKTISTPPIRVLKCEINTLPTMTGIPMLSQFEQPFDQMGFVWVSGNAGGGAVSGIDRATVDLINAEVFNNSAHSELVYRDPRKSTADPSILGSNPTKDLVILSGSHLFVVVEEDGISTAVVDYCFNTNRPPSYSLQSAKDSSVLPTDNGAILDYSVQEEVGDVPSAPNDQQGGASGVLQKSVGPLTVSGLSLKFQDPNLRMAFDATIDLGALKASIKGFGVEFPLASLYDMRLVNIKLLIDGVGLELNEQPVSLAGDIMKKLNAYFGGVDLSIEPYSFLGGGYYGTNTYNDATVAPPKATTFDTTFVFAELAGPFVELEFASLSGLTAGFGHNSHMTLPTIDNVTTFPFLKPVTGNDPLSVLNGFLIPPGSGTPWFGHDKNAQDETWMAAGFTAKAFHTLDVDTVMTVDFSKSDISIGLFAHATCTVPPEANQADMFARADMGLLAVLDWSKGILKIEGQLTPQSFILDKDCKLTGGFALCYFFEGSGHNGDWVFSIGGYHPSFKTPAWYPTPPRVGISWILDSTISISGQAYFAVTPKSAMGGGKLDLVFHSGKLKAWFDAYADFLVNYKPFSFQAELGVSIGISYTLEVFCITKRFGINFGCSLYIHGPPVAGYVHVGWSIISFDIHFGSAHETTTSLQWIEFQDLIRQDGRVTPNGQTPPTLLKASATNGIIDDPDTNPQNQISTSDDTATSVSTVVWNVNHAIFSFDLTSMFPLTSVILNGHSLNKVNDGWAETAVDPFGAQKSLDDIYMRPMQVKTKATSTLTVTVQLDKDKSAAPLVATQVIKQVPTAVWDACRSIPDISCYLQASR